MVAEKHSEVENKNLLCYVMIIEIKVDKFFECRRFGSAAFLNLRHFSNQRDRMMRYRKNLANVISN